MFLEKRRQSALRRIEDIDRQRDRFRLDLNDLRPALGALTNRCTFLYFSVKPMACLRTYRSPRISLLAAFLFVFFLLLSAPHQVHHSLEGSQANQCVVFTAAKGCDLRPLPFVSLPVITQIFLGEIFPSVEVRITEFTPLPFSIRAPPAV